MWLSRIELINFKSYIHQKFQFPKPENGCNLVLIGGMNGFGKTTLLEAIYLCFYGSEAVTHLARAGLHSDAYGKFLKKALHGKAISLKRNTMEVVIAFQTDDIEGYEISRRWHFDLQGSYQEEEVKVYELRGGLRGNPISKEELTTIFDDHVVPAHLAPFFFFDGEEVKKLADQDRREWIQQGMESLLGVVLLRGLRDRLEQYQNNKKPSGKSSMDEEKLDDLYKGLTIQEQQLEELRNRQLRCIEQRGDAEDRRDEVHQRLSAIGAGGGGVKQVENIVREEGEKREALNKSDAAIDKILSEKLPFHLVSKQIADDLKFQLQEEATLLDWENKKHSVEPQKERFVEAFFSTDFTRPMDKQTKDKLHESIDFAWQGLFNPKPEGCAKELLHDYLEPRQRQRLNDQFDKIVVGYRDIKTLFQQRNTLERAIQELERERIRLEALHDDGTLHQLQDEMKTVQAELDKLNENIGDMNRCLSVAGKPAPTFYVTFSL
ncbi:MAG: AAA family ATPase [Proteobacteria bacterium]|nr:AAA family ATPase [Pseudomonadota bacterium]